jgi:hypothetical protein
MRWHHTLALQTWAEPLRDPVLHKRARALYLETLDHIGWPAGGAMRGTYRRTRIPMPLPRRCFSLMHGLIVMHHIVDDVPADALRNELSLLGAAVVGPYTLPATQPQEAQP